MKPFWYDWTLEDWTRWAGEQGLPGYRARQIFRWTGRGITRWAEMTNVPRAVRERMGKSVEEQGLTLERENRSDSDGTVKAAFRLRDGNLIETVLMRYRFGTSVCISSQAGCRMGCTFCASTGAGFGRDLTAGEMVAQAAVLGALSGERVDRVTVMGIGEPFDNYDNLIRFLRLANHPDGLGIGMRHITVSTCGLIPEMLKFADEDLQVNLSISLHAPDDRTRTRLMPVARRYPIQDLMDACRTYIRKTGRRITFEYALLDGVNDSAEQAGRLAALLKGMLCHVNLIPANEYAEGRYRRSSGSAIRAFQSVLEDARIPVTVRRELGTDIQAACGQLRRSLSD